jgi:hypothetical protein
MVSARLAAFQESRRVELDPPIQALLAKSMAETPDSPSHTHPAGTVYGLSFDQLQHLYTTLKNDPAFSDVLAQNTGIPEQQVNERAIVRARMQAWLRYISVTAGEAELNKTKQGGSSRKKQKTG